MDFCHLHCHSHYSLTEGLDGYNSPAHIIERAAELGQQAIALTDHGVMYGVVEFQRAAKKNGIKPIIGMEGYVSRGDHTEKTPANRENAHLLMLAMNKTGYTNLMHLNSIAHNVGYYYRPRISHSVIEKHHEGIIFTSACIGGEVNLAIKQGQLGRAREVAAFYRDLVGDRFYLELQYHPAVPELREYNAELVRISVELGIELVVTADAHFTHPDEAEAHRFIKSTRWNKPYGDFCDQYEPILDTSFAILGAADLWKHVSEYGIRPMENAAAIASRIENYDLGRGKVQLPAVYIPEGESAASYLRLIAQRGLNDRGVQSSAYNERLDYELGVINQTGFPDYMLIVWDIVRYARKRGIPCLPRGSAGASLVLYCLGVTEVDPIPNGLLFERFLSPERLEMPDIDIDFADSRRAEIFQYIADKYGRDNVAQIATFGRLGAKQALRDAGRSLEIPLGEVDMLAKMVHPKARTIGQARALNPEMDALIVGNPQFRDLVQKAEYIEGKVKSVGTHACGIVVAAHPLSAIVPTQPTKDGGVMAAFESQTLADLGLLKIDILGLTNLAVAADTITMIRANHGVAIELSTIPLGDEEVFKSLGRGETVNVFQMESAGMTRYLMELKPSKVGDLYAMVALYRPGPLEQIPVYIKNKNNPDRIKYLHPILKPILEDTYGVIVYQEQIMLLLQAIAGYTLGAAYIVLKAIGKKNPELMAREEPVFLRGCIANGLTETQAKGLWDLIQPFAGYSFNRPHATLYGLLSYQTAWLKLHYPAEYMAATLIHDSGDIDRIALAGKESARLGIPILAPSVSTSNQGFTITHETGGTQIRFGLGAVKHVGDNAIHAILQERGVAPFADFEDFVTRLKASATKKTLEALIKAGACDHWGIRQALLKVLPELLKVRKAALKSAASGVQSMFGALEIKTMRSSKGLCIETEDHTEWQMERLQWEREYLGLYLTDHPVTEALKHTAIQRNWVSLGQATNVIPNSPVSGVALVETMKKIQTKKGETMSTFTLSDATGSIGAVAFPKTHATLPSQFMLDSAIIAWGGKFDNSRGELQLIIDWLADVEDARPAPPVQRKQPTTPLHEWEADDVPAIWTEDETEAEAEETPPVGVKDEKRLYTIIHLDRANDQTSILGRINSVLLGCPLSIHELYISFYVGTELVFMILGDHYRRTLTEQARLTIQEWGNVHIRDMQTLPNIRAI